MSRPGKGVEHVESLEGEAGAKRRLRAVLETIAGDLTVEEACARLGVSASRFAQLREEALSGALRALEPRPAGRPSAPPADPEVTRLSRENAELRHDLEAARIRAEMALVMPGLLRPLEAGEKKGSAPGPRGRSGG
jgi:transposase-like protein